MAPEVPTVDEAGVPGYDVTVWFGILAPAGVPKEIIARLNTEMVKIMRSPEVADRFNKAGVDVVASSSEYFTDFLKSEVARWAKVVQDANIKAD
jgi:tripartite-type tricarboxylate transporter receptor subunit TctC